MLLLNNGKVLSTILGALVLTSTSVLALTESELQCGTLKNAYGPLDYRSASPDNKQLVEGAHFTREVEQLIRGKTSSTPAGDLDYTLRVFPNHPRALYSLMKWGERTKTDRPSGAHWPIWCYFDRAIRFQPEDAQVRALYGVYLHKKGRFSESLEQLKEAERFAGESANVLYNIGLVYLDLNNSEKALE